MRHRVQMIGLCRFSYLFSQGTGFAKATALADGGYDEVRLERRLWLFETMTLPSLASQTDPDFVLVILIGRGLPPAIRGRLDAITRPHPQFVLHAEDEGHPHINLCRAVLLQHRDPDRPMVGEFRMDDDDAVSVDFIERSRRYFEDIENLVQDKRGVELDFCNGLALNFSGRMAEAKEVTVAHWGSAQVFFNPTSSARTAFHYHHYKAWLHHLCVSAPDRMMFVRSFHEYNDSSRKWENLGSPLARRSLEGRFGFDLDRIIAP